MSPRTNPQSLNVQLVDGRVVVDFADSGLSGEEVREIVLRIKGFAPENMQPSMPEGSRHTYVVAGGNDATEVIRAAKDQLLTRCFARRGTITLAGPAMAHKPMCWAGTDGSDIVLMLNTRATPGDHDRIRAALWDSLVGFKVKQVIFPDAATEKPVIRICFNSPNDASAAKERVRDCMAELGWRRASGNLAVYPQRSAGREVLVVLIQY